MMQVWPPWSGAFLGPLSVWGIFRLTFYGLSNAPGGALDPRTDKLEAPTIRQERPGCRGALDPRADKQEAAKHRTRGGRGGAPTTATPPRTAPGKREAPERHPRAEGAPTEKPRGGSPRRTAQRGTTKARRGAPEKGQTTPDAARGGKRRGTTPEDNSAPGPAAPERGPNDRQSGGPRRATRSTAHEAGNRQRARTECATNAGLPPNAPPQKAGHRARSGGPESPPDEPGPGETKTPARKRKGAPRQREEAPGPRPKRGSAGQLRTRPRPYLDNIETPAVILGHSLTVFLVRTCETKTVIWGRQKASPGGMMYVLPNKHTTKEGLMYEE